MFLTLLLGALGLLLVSAGIEDARSRNIANWKNAAIALLAPAWWWANGLALWPDVATQIGVASIVFIFFIGAFAIGQMGGGDVKMLGALALWLPVQPLIYMLVLMSLVGGALTIVMVADRWTQLSGGLRKLPWRTIAPILAAAAAAVALVYSSRLSVARALLGQPIATAIVAMALVTGLGVLLLVGARAARKRGIVPETPYGVAIAISALLVLREPILNQFT
ncbi:prepilin peptidase [Sphingomonas sp. Root241]|uniref:A24 family peptidase n=1 Tax=Sphingomonas sp. Root241 TaxID=1736501 RepID=UPI002AA29E33|nr:prepilin peptidase [Sphingomonas sp. Root241]